MQEVVVSESLRALSIHEKIPLWAHQREAVAKAKGISGYGLFFEMGTGKTATACNILRGKWRQAGHLVSTLILAPPIVLENWRRELLAHTDVPKDRIVVLSGTGKKRLELLDRAMKLYGTRFVAITNYEGLLMAPLYANLLERWRPQCLVVDESHRCKDIKARRTKLAIQLADQADLCRLILTGTPVLNSPMDLFAQYRIMDRGEALGKNYFVFRNNYFTDFNAYMPKSRYFPDFRPTPEGLEKLNKIIQQTASRVTKAECMDLPPLVRKAIEVEMSPEQAKHYQEMKNDFVTYLQDRACIAQLAITKALRLQQIVSGYIPLEDEAGSQTIKELRETPREAAVKELLAEVAPYHKVLVWAVFKHNYAVLRRICDELGLKYVEIHGEVSQKEKEAAAYAIQKDPTVRVLIGHPQSGGLGVTLTAASYSIYYSRSFSLEQKVQSESRNHRAGSQIHEKITQIDILAKGTIDEITCRALEAKEHIGLELLRREVCS